MIVEFVGDYLRIGNVSINTRKIKMIRSQGTNVLVDASGREKDFHPGNIFAIDYQDVTGPDTFASAQELEDYLLQGSNVNPLPPADALKFEGTEEYIFFEGESEPDYITFETN